jgi:serine/threonine protein kinase
MLRVSGKGGIWGLPDMKTPLNRYEIIGTLGTGASSRVDKARDSTIGRTVALKTFLHGFGSGDLQTQFLREAQIIGGLAHSCIVSLYDVGTNIDGLPYLVMEYVDGKTLERTLDAGPLPLERAVVWAADLASALARAHRSKIIHGDVKPANVFITSEGRLKLGDFGIARFATQMSGSGSILGTPAYLSPEQILGHKQDTRSDLFSLGIILYQMTTGVRPFDGTSVGAVCAQIVSAEPPPPSHHNAALPPEFDHIVMRCLAKDPAERYADAESLGASLYPFARSKPLPIRSPSRSWWKRPMQISDLRAVGGVLLALSVLGVGARAVREHFSAATVHAVSVRQTPTVLSAAPPPDDAVALGTGLGASPSASVINVGMAEKPATSSHNPSPSHAEAMSETSAKADSASGLVAGSDAPSPAGPSVEHAFERNAVASTKPKTIHSTSDAPATPLSSSMRSSALPKQAAATAVKSAGSPLPKTSLQVDIVSSVADENISIFAGDELLLSTLLKTAHLGDTMRFECPVTPGEHSFRVVLSRLDETVMVEKDSTSQIRADASNFLGIHVNRRTKLLLKHETSLEVVWPSTAAPVAASLSPHPVGELALR